MEPSIKGLLLLGAVSGVRSAIRQGAISRSDVEARLNESERRYLEEQVEPTQWYPVSAMGSFLEIGIELAPIPRDQAIHAMGRMGAERARETGLYPQLDFEVGKLEQATPAQARSFARLLATAWNAFYSFGSWSYRDGSHENVLFSVDLKEIEALPEILHPASESFMLTVLGWAWGRDLVSDTRRVSPNHTHFEVRYA